MRATTTTPPAVAAVLVATLALTGCGDDGTAVSRGDECRIAVSPRPGAPVGDGAKDAVRIIETTGFAPAPERCADRELTAEFEVTNGKREPYTYTVTFSVTDASSGRAHSTGPVTVAAVQAGGTVRRTFTAPHVPSEVRASARVSVTEVRSVPTDEVGSPSGGCPPSGVRVTAGQGNAAMGLRVVGVTLTNCGTRPYTLDGHPGLTPLDEDHRPLDGVRILPGGGDIAQVTGFDAAPRPVTLAPGETATTDLMWRNTHTGYGEAASAPYVRLVPKPGAPPVTLIPELDLGTTGKLGVSAWQKPAKGSR
ncbi:DUF4232 domain-containing protein [Streptomyces sp. NPDC006798]|uniref:DUF4232 domain-containing protein n=1 Tax=Streptomyces sp. NPDC006798 TaxID=3155462 RepID=UPI0033F3FC8C